MIDFKRVQEIEEQDLFNIRKKSDQTFGLIFIFQWVLITTISFIRSPYSWSGNQASIHPHLYFSILLGGSLAAGPMYFIFKNPGAKINMYLVTLSQMLFSSLIIHVSGGRIESHFHIFGSLAFLTCYKSSRVIIFGTCVALVDHLLRGEFFPETIYGTDFASPLRALEHAGWMIFEDAFLLLMIRDRVHDFRDTAVTRQQLEESLETVENRVISRTKELEISRNQLEQQQETLVNSARLSSLGEMAANMAHEINNPLAIISATSMYMHKKLKDEVVDRAFVEENLKEIDKTVKRINSIVVGLRNLSRDSSLDPASACDLQDIIGDVLIVCEQKMRNSGVRFEVVDHREDKHDALMLNRVQLSQVLLNLINNSFDAIEKLEEKWIKILIVEENGFIRFNVTDSGAFISKEIQEKIFKPFFTTKGFGKGTGLGLSLSRSLLHSFGGDLFLDRSWMNTCFVIKVPKISCEETV